MDLYLHECPESDSFDLYEWPHISLDDCLAGLKNHELFTDLVE